ncbi:endonuclease VII domain-containing protein [Streptomyces sp. NPDC051362]|uniref:endonuclease VII domain-containing protein n=1 Tax=Streptomyces sp. NPDC051362 TaxID=3365651 RepID=UPI00379575C5
MGRPRTPWKLGLSEVQARYEAGESAESLGQACGVSYQAVIRALREAGVEIRKSGGRPGPRRGHVSVRETRTCKGERCANEFEVYPSSNKRFCSPACRYSSPEIAKLMATNIRNRHRLSEIDSAARTAMCSVCGPVDVRQRREKKKYATTAVLWRCRSAERARVWARQYGADSTTIRAMWESQGRRCAICRTALGERFNVDHCHASSRIRGLLCSQCNTGLGLFADTPQRLRAAADYLERTGDVNA